MAALIAAALGGHLGAAPLSVEPVEAPLAAAAALAVSSSVFFVFFFFFFGGVSRGVSQNVWFGVFFLFMLWEVFRVYCF